MTAARVDLVLPCLNEAEALPAVLAAVPPGIRPIVVDNRSTDGSADVARALGAEVVTESRRGFGAAAHAGLVAAAAPLVAFCDADGSMDPRELLPMADLVEQGRADLVMARRRPRGRGSWPLHGRIGNAVLARQLSRRVGVRLHDLGPMRVARREALLGLGLQDRRSGYPLEMVLKAGAAGWRIVECDGSYVPRVGRSKVTGTVRGTLTAVLDMSRRLPGGVMTDLVVIAKECLPGRVKTRLHPPFSLEEAAELAAASLDDTLDALAALPFARRILAFDGTTPPRLARGWDVVPQSAGGLDERLAAVFDALDGPTVLVGMDTPQLGAAVLSAVLPDWPTDADAVFGPALDGGFWALGMREPRGDLIRGVPMSQHDTGAHQLARLSAADLRVRLLPPLVDVDDLGSARRVAEAAPDGRFAATLRRLDRPALAGAA